MTSRKDIRRNLTETFAYDNLDRLTGATIGTNNYLKIDYEPSGNILKKSDVGKYLYNLATKPHALIQKDSLVATTNIPDIQKEQNIDYTAFNMVEKIEENGNKLEFVYGVDNQRLKTQLYNGGILAKTKYFAANYEEVIIGSDTTKINYIAGGDGLAALYIIDKDKIGKTYYAYSDHLGSIISITDNNGAIIPNGEQSFDPWGRRRNITNWTQTGAQEITIIDRGYTGHEHLNEFGIINMNGRLYDPLLGRVLSPDPALQLPGNTQNYNRYSYCLNNPLKYSDPSGNLTTIGYTTSNTAEIARIFAFVIGGGDLNNFNFAPYGNVENLGDGGAAWSEITFSNDNSYGIRVIGNSEFVERTNAAIDKIAQSRLGQVALSRVAQGSYINPFLGTPITIFPYEMASESQKAEQPGAFYDNNAIYLRFYEDIPSDKHIQHYPDGFIPEDDFLILGHEVWHAYLDRVDVKYNTCSEYFKEGAATGFENYLADVFEVNHIRRYYNTHDGSEHQLWDVEVIRSDFNPYHEKVGMFWTIPISYGGNSLYTTPSLYLSSEFYFYQLPKIP